MLTKTGEGALVHQRRSGHPGGKNMAENKPSSPPFAYLWLQSQAKQQQIKYTLRLKVNTILKPVDDSALKSAELVSSKGYLTGAFPVAAMVGK